MRWSCPSIAVASILAMASSLASVGGCKDDGQDDGPSPGLPSRSPTDGGDGGSTRSPTSGTTDGGVALLAPFVAFDVNHVLVAGQSNSLGNSATPPLTTTQPFGNLMFDTGPMSMKGGFSNPEDHASARTAGCDGEGCTAYDAPTGFVPLVEGDRYFDYEVETPASGLANEISLLATTKHALPKHDVLVSIHSRSGTGYVCLRKTSCDYKPDYLPSFEQGMKEVESGKALSAAAGKSYVVRAVVAIHGENDHAAYSAGNPEFPLDGTDGRPGATTDYTAALLEWQRDYEAGVKAITGQTLPIPMFISQLSGWTDVPVSKLAQMQLDAHEQSGGRVILVGPAYALSLSQVDCLHFTNDGERRLGEYVAKAYARVIFEGRPWEPVRPKTVTRDGATITVVFHVPKPPLALDTTRVAAAENFGFTYADDGGTAAIAAVELAGPDTVRITLSAPPTGAERRLRYAMNQAPGADACAGTPKGPRGNLRDSDDTPSQYGYDLHNWAVHFDVPVP